MKGIGIELELEQYFSQKHTLNYATSTSNRPTHFFPTFLLFLLWWRAELCDLLEGVGRDLGGDDEFEGRKAVLLALLQCMQQLPSTPVSDLVVIQVDIFQNWTGQDQSGCFHNGNNDPYILSRIIRDRIC